MVLKRRKKMDLIVSNPGLGHIADKIFNYLLYHKIHGCNILDIGTSSSRKVQLADIDETSDDSDDYRYIPLEARDHRCLCLKTFLNCSFVNRNWRTFFLSKRPQYWLKQCHDRVNQDDSDEWIELFAKYEDNSPVMKYFAEYLRRIYFTYIKDEENEYDDSPDYLHNTWNSFASPLGELYVR